MAVVSLALNVYFACTHMSLTAQRDTLRVQLKVTRKNFTTCTSHLQMRTSSQSTLETELSHCRNENSLFRYSDMEMRNQFVIVNNTISELQSGIMSEKLKNRELNKKLLDLRARLSSVLRSIQTPERK